MSDIQFKKHRVFRETEDVIFYDISVDESNASDLVVTLVLLYHLLMMQWEQNNFIYMSIKMTTIVWYQESELLS